MKKFNYTMNHKADEAYMAKMCHEGWAATSLVEGVWTFEPCKPDRYTFRIFCFGYLCTQGLFARRAKRLASAAAVSMSETKNVLEKYKDLGR